MLGAARLNIQPKTIKALKREYFAQPVKVMVDDVSIQELCLQGFSTVD